MSSHSRRRSPALFLLPVLAAACTDASPTGPGIQGPPVAAVPAMQCTVDVRGEAMSCTAPDPALTSRAIAANRLLGGQDVYVKLANTGGTYDAGTEIFEINVTVQNLLAASLGTTDGSTVSGVRIFFPEQPSTTGGSGEVTLQNALTGFFTGPDQPYFEYPQILTPYQVSVAQPWRFNVPTSVTRFGFMVYMSAPQADESQPLLDRVWDGSAGTAWTDGQNWEAGVAPDSGSTVSVPPDSLFAGSMPALTADAQLSYLRVGGGSTLDLDGFTLTAWGNVDAPGVIAGGLLQMSGAGALLRGSISSLRVTGGVQLQGATRATQPVSVSDGVLANGGYPLTISLP